MVHELCMHASEVRGVLGMGMPTCSSLMRRLCSAAACWTLCSRAAMSAACCADWMAAALPASASACPDLPTTRPLSSLS